MVKPLCAPDRMCSRPTGAQPTMHADILRAQALFSIQQSMSGSELAVPGAQPSTPVPFRDEGAPTALRVRLSDQGKALAVASLAHPPALIVEPEAHDVVDGPAAALGDSPTRKKYRKTLTQDIIAEMDDTAFDPKTRVKMLRRMLWMLPAGFVLAGAINAFFSLRPDVIASLARAIDAQGKATVSMQSPARPAAPVGALAVQSAEKK